MKTFTAFDTYFEKLGISTRFNTLGYDSNLISAFVEETRGVVGKTPSNHCKAICYDKYYDMVNRPKYTGFEWAKEEDHLLREKLYKSVSADQTQEQFFLDKTTEAGIDYKTCLTNSLSGIEGAVIYLSGGLDSELVARAALEAGTQFVPVILQYVKCGKIMNAYDTVYAEEFCAKNSLAPHFIQIDVLSVWESSAFYDLAVAMGTVSPQQALYGYAVLEVEKAFPGALHMFGGEVRYLTDVEGEESKLADLVMLAKIMPGYNGQSYTIHWDGTNPLAYTSIDLFYSNSGSWSIASVSDGGSHISLPITGSPQSGTWTTTPGSAYEVNVTTTSLSVPSPIVSSTPANGASSGWTSIGANTRILRITGSGGSPADGQASYSIQCRATLNPATVVTSTVTFNVDP